METNEGSAGTEGLDLWQAAIRILEQTLVPNQLRAWILPLEFESLESKGSDQQGGQIALCLSAPNDFFASWVRDHYIRELEAALTQVIGSPCKITFKTNNRPVEELPENPLAPITPEVSSGTAQGIILQTGSRTVAEVHLDPRYTFSNFVVGASNQFAHASAVAVAERPAMQYNPLFLYSSPGLGKTHLLHAVGNHVLSKNPNLRVGYLSAESFVNELIESIQHHKMSQFRTKYRDSYDILLIDDVQFIAGRHKTEEEFFHTFNALHGSRRQIVVTSDRPPKEISGLEERIRTRFEWGLVADIQAPEIETRIAILKAKAERDDIYLPDDVATFLATHVRTNVRELEGLLIRLQAQASLTGAEISLEMAKQELKMSLPEEGSLLTVESIQVAVAKHFQIKIQDLKSTARNKTVALPRQIAMFLVRKYTGMGFREIGQVFGGKDHSTILHACQKIEGGFDGDPEIRVAVESIQNLL